MASWIFFDMDGTLIDSVPALYRSYVLFLRSHGVRGSEKEFEKLNGPSLAECVQILMARYQLKGSFEKNMNCYFSIVQKEEEKVMARPGAGMVLADLKNKGHKLSLVTSASTLLTRKILKKTRWEDMFDHVTCGEEVVKGKPSPDIYQLALKKAGCKAGDVLVVEDSKNGLKAARRAGLKAIHVDKYFAKHPGIYALWQGPLIRAISDEKDLPSKKDRIFSVRKVTTDAKKAHFHGSYVPYKKFKKSMRSAVIPKKIHVLAVSGLAKAMKGKEPHFLIGLRSRYVSSYKNYWEFVPSGGVDGESLDVHGKIGLARTLMRELREESGLTERDVQNLRTMGIVHDQKVGAYDCGYLINLKPSALEQMKLDHDPKEYSRMLFLDRRGIDRLLKTEKRVAPTALLFWDMYFSSRNKKGAL